MQKDLKRLVAYSSVAHMGFIVLGIFALNTQGLQGSVIQMVNHGISTGALFILVGWIYERRHTREIAALGGLQSSAPMMAGVFTLVMLSSVGLPGLNGFVGEFLILLGAFSSGTVVGRRRRHRRDPGRPLPAVGLPADASTARPRATTPRWTISASSELLGIAPLLALIVFLGIYPKPVLERIEPAVERPDRPHGGQGHRTSTKTNRCRAFRAGTPGS